jgi:hypothetical protein
MAAADAANVAAAIANSLLHDLTNEPESALARRRRKRKVAEVQVECDLTGEEEAWSAHVPAPSAESPAQMAHLEID